MWAVLGILLAGCVGMHDVQSMPGVYVGTVTPYQFATVTSTSAGPDGYEAVNATRARRSASGSIRSEDKILDQSRRTILSSNAMDLHRNAVLFAWAIRRHLDYTTLFDFQPLTGDDSLDADLRALMERDSRPDVCDIGGRHSWNKLRRLAEIRKTLDGDCGLLQLRNGALQGIESHMIRNPTMERRDADQWVLGCKLDRGRRARAYCIKDIDHHGTASERIVPASQLMLLAAFEGRFDQVRGISPIAGALNEFRDIYEIKDLMQQKVKLEQIFGVAFMRNRDSEDLGAEFGSDGDTTTEDETSPSDTGPPPSYDCGQGVKGFDLDTDEDLKIIESSNPSGNTQDFLRLAISVAIKALDLPFNFFDEAHTNFFGSRAAWIQYERAAHARREDQLELHRRYTIWRIRRWLLPMEFGGTGELVLPASMTLDQIRWKWVPRGIPWWNPQEELTVDLMAVAAGLKTFQTVCDERGLGVWTQNLQQLQREFREAQTAGFALTFQQQKLPASLSFTTEPAASEETA